MSRLKQFLWCMVLALPLTIKAQGIRFEKGLNWTQIQEKAKLENKYIFMDCYATWCGPCKWMDAEVYPKEKVGNFMNARFVSVKVQLDSTNADDDMTRAWRGDSKTIQKTYDVNEMPTFLFFSPEGKIVHRFSGTMVDIVFMGSAAAALDTAQQFYAWLTKYRKGQMLWSDIPRLAIAANADGFTKLADTLAISYFETLLNQPASEKYAQQNIVDSRTLFTELHDVNMQDYINRYLLSAPNDKLYTKDNIKFIGRFTTASNQESFQFLWRNEKKLHGIANLPILQFEIGNIITKEEITPRLYVHQKPVKKEPYWNRLIAHITKKYDSEYAQRTVLDARIAYYGAKNDWDDQIKFAIIQKEKYGLDTSSGLGFVSLNNFNYLLVFQHTGKLNYLNKAIYWQKLILNKEKTSPAYLDTYANLLYRAHRVKEAIACERKAEQMAQDDSQCQHVPPDPSYQATIEKMTKGQPTWQQ